LGAHLPHAGRGGREGKQHPLWVVRRRLDRQGFAHPVDGRAHAGRRGLGEHLQPLRPHFALWRLQGIRVWPRGRAPRPSALRGARLMAEKNGADRVEIRKTYKLYVAGEFVRSESGRAYRPDGSINVPRGSRKDLRDAVKAARGAFTGWAGRTAMNRGQILYRAAEMLDARRSQFVDLLE